MFGIANFSRVASGTSIVAHHVHQQWVSVTSRDDENFMRRFHQTNLEGKSASIHECFKGPSNTKTITLILFLTASTFL